jgi:hypothetical protein
MSRPSRGHLQADIWNILGCLDSWTEHFVVSLWNNQQMCRGSSIIYWCIPNFTPTCFSNSLPSSGGSYLPQKLLNQYRCCGCIRITICPVWPVVVAISSQANDIYKYKNIKRKLLNCSANIFFNRRCLQNGLTPNYANIKIPNPTEAARYTKIRVRSPFRTWSVHFIVCFKYELEVDP